jgi:hypothetical protein
MCLQAWFAVVSGVCMLYAKLRIIVVSNSFLLRYLPKQNHVHIYTIRTTRHQSQLDLPLLNLLTG